MSFTQYPYNLSFRALALRPELARLVGEVFLLNGDWEQTKKQVLATNVLQARSVESAKRMERELQQRLSTLSRPQLELLVHGASEESVAMTWLAACKRIVFVREFTIEVAREKLMAQDPILRPSDYESFINSKSASYPELLSLTEISRNKVRQVLFQMLREAGLLREVEAGKALQRPVLSPSVQKVILNDDARWLAVFLVPDAEIMNL